MAIAYVKEVATANNNGTTASFTVAVASAPSAGNTLVLCCRCSPNTGSGYSATFSDSKGNTWSTDFEYKENFQYLMIASTRQDVGALTTSDTITFTLNMARASNAATFVWVEEFSGMASSSYTDGAAATNNNSTTTQLSGSVTPTQDADLVVALNDTQNSTVTETLNGTGTVGTFSSFTTAHINSSGVGNSRVDYPVYQILSTGSGTAQKHAWTLSSATYSDMLIGLYKVAPPPADTRAFMAFMP